MKSIEELCHIGIVEEAIDTTIRVTWSEVNTGKYISSCRENMLLYDGRTCYNCDVGCLCDCVGRLV